MCPESLQSTSSRTLQELDSEINILSGCSDIYLPSLALVFILQTDFYFFSGIYNS